MAKKIEAWEAEVDNGSATPTPPKKSAPPPPPPPAPAPKAKAKAKRKTYPVGQTEDDMSINMKKGGSVGSASKRADGCAQRGKTRGKMV
jgi:hypothetical protein